MQPKTGEVIYVRDLQRTRRFYTALGFVLKEESHESGPTHYSVDFGGFVLEFYPAKNTASVTPPSKSRLLIVEVDRFAHVLTTCSAMGLDRKAVGYYDKERNLRSVLVHDPDGWRVRVLELLSETKPSIC